MNSRKSPEETHHAGDLLLHTLTLLRQPEDYQKEGTEEKDADERPRFKLDVQRDHFSKLKVFIVEILYIALHTKRNLICLVGLVNYLFGRLSVFLR